MNIFFDLECVSDGEYGQENIDKYGERINFLPEFNKIFTICMGVKTKEGTTVKNLDGTEEEILIKFFDAIRGNTLIGFNIKKFDIPFIIKRALYYKLSIPGDLKIFGKKPWEVNNVIDLQEVYSYNIFGSVGTLDLCCKFLGITSPKNEGIDGSLVQKFYNEGKENEIIEYCKRDVASCIEIYDYFYFCNLI